MLPLQEWGLMAHALSLGLVTFMTMLAGIVAYAKRATTLSIGFFLLTLASSLWWLYSSYPGQIFTGDFLFRWFVPINNILQALAWTFILVGVFKLPKPA